MTSRYSTAALAVAIVTSSAALAEPPDWSTTNTIETPGAYFHCYQAHGPAFRTGPCWLDYVGRNAR